MNLSFRVLRKRPDGYHEIASLYQAIDLFDRLFFSPAEKDLLTCTDPSIPTDETNLVHKALTLFRRHYSIGPVKIHIEKKIPIQAGLGGGSSNAATTLKALNELLDHPASKEELLQMAATLGSDVPFFFSSGAAYCTGRGEIMQDTPFEPLSGWLAKPPYGLSTPLVYKHTIIEELPNRASANDLELAAFRLEPRLIALKEALRRDFQQVAMTGSGTAFVCLNGSPRFLEDITFYRFSSIRLTG